MVLSKISETVAKIMLESSIIVSGAVDNLIGESGYCLHKDANPSHFFACLREVEMFTDEISNVRIAATEALASLGPKVVMNDSQMKVRCNLTRLFVFPNIYAPPFFLSFFFI
jgi:hypothetical protein